MANAQPPPQGFAIVFSEDTNALFDRLRRAIRQKLFTDYQIELEDFQGENHITLVQQVNGMPRTAADTVLRDLSHIYNMYRQKGEHLIVKPSAQPFFYQPYGWLFFNVDLTDAISNLHMCAARYSVDYMQGGSPDRMPRGAIDDMEIEAFGKYGYRYMFSAYTIPHVTIGRLKTDQDIQRFNMFMRNIMSDVDEMVMDIFRGTTGLRVAGFTHYEMGRFGSHASRLGYRSAAAN